MFKYTVYSFGGALQYKGTLSWKKTVLDFWETDGRFVTGSTSHIFFPESKRIVQLISSVENKDIYSSASISPGTLEPVIGAANGGKLWLLTSDGALATIDNTTTATTRAILQKEDLLNQNALVPLSSSLSKLRGKLFVSETGSVWCTWKDWKKEQSVLYQYSADYAMFFALVRKTIGVSGYKALFWDDGEIIVCSDKDIVCRSNTADGTIEIKKDPGNRLNCLEITTSFLDSTTKTSLVSRNGRYLLETELTQGVRTTWLYRNLMHHPDFYKYGKENVVVKDQCLAILKEYCTQNTSDQQCGYLDNDRLMKENFATVIQGSPDYTSLRKYVPCLVEGPLKLLSDFKTSNATWIFRQTRSVCVM